MTPISIVTDNLHKGILSFGGCAAWRLAAAPLSGAWGLLSPEWALWPRPSWPCW